MPGGGDDRVVRGGVDVAEQLTVHLRVGDRRCQVIGGVLAAGRGETAEVSEKIQQGQQLLLRSGAALEFGVVTTEEFLGEFEHPVEVRFGNAEQRHDDVQREVHRDILCEIAGTAGLQQFVHVSGGEFIGAEFHVPHGLRPEPVGSDGAQHTMLGIVDMDQGLELDPHGCLLVQLGLLLEVHQQRTRFVDPERVIALDVHDVVVLGDRPERSIVVGDDSRHGLFTP